MPTDTPIYLGQVFETAIGASADDGYAYRQYSHCWNGVAADVVLESTNVVETGYPKRILSPMACNPAGPATNQRHSQYFSISSLTQCQRRAGGRSETAGASGS